MLGLIKKDLLMAKGNSKMLAIILLVFIFITINADGNLSFIPAFISVMIMMSTFSYDEYNKTDAYLTTLPNGKKNVVRAKYIATLLIIFLALLITLGTSFVVGWFQNNLNAESIVATTIGGCIGIILLISVFYPCIFKFGIEKSRIAIFIIVFGISGGVSFIMSGGMTFSFPKNIITLFYRYWMIIVPFITIIILLISYKISETIYLKKEF